MDGTQQIRANRRDVMKAVGGAAATTALGAGLTGSATASHDQSDAKGIRVNQVGYPMDELKVAHLTSAAMDLGSVSEFEVVDAESGETVASDSINNSEPYPNSSMEDAHGSDHTVAWADFTDMVTEPGEYKIVAGDAESHPFTVDSASNVYDELLRDVGRLYTLKRSCTDIDDPHTGLDIGPGHTQDEEAIVADVAEGENDFLAEEDVSPGDTIDVSWGWYDAGDYGKYVNPGALTVAQMMLAYERNPDAFHTGQFYAEDALVNPSDDYGSIPDVLIEAKQELKFLQAMQRSSGALFYKLSGKEWPSMDTAPGDDDLDRYVFGNSSVGTAHACGAFAMAARVFEDHDSEFADEMLTCAENAWSWLEDNPDLVWDLSASQNGGSGAYNRGPSGTAPYDEPARYWAAAELLRTTGDSTYDDWIVETDLSYEGQAGSSELPGDVEGPIDWNGVAGLGNYAYWKAEGSAAVDGDSGGATGGLTSSIWIAQRYNDSSPNDSFQAWTTGVYDYYWGHLKSGISRAQQGLWSIEAYQYLDENTSGNFGWITSEAVSKMVRGPLHHALGRSATGYCYVTGHGTKSTMNPHDRIIQSQGMDAPIPGMLVGGPHNNVFGDSLEGDKTSSHVSEDTPHLLSYYDAHGSYATNEWAINYTAPLFLMLAEVVGEISSTPEPDYENLGDDDDTPDAPTSPSDQWTNEVTTSTIEMGWESVDGATGYEVYLDGEMMTTVTDGTTYTFTGLSPDTEYTVGIASVNDAGSSEMKETMVTTMDDGGEPEEGVEVGEETVCDADGDGLYKDINCDGEVTHTDVQQFFQHQHRPAWKQPDMFDYSDNDVVSHGDVISLFEEVATNSM